MIPIGLALPWFLLGIPVLAGLLFLLHRLRIRHRRLEVVTTLFWQEAIEEARARVFVQRFRHPLVYAFLLLLSLLLWAGFADPRLASDPEEQSLILIEGSSQHMSTERTAAALDSVEDLLASMPENGRTVLWCGAQERTLLGSGEPAALLASRWEGLAPEHSPSKIARIVDGMSALQAQAPEGSRLPLHVIVVGAVSLPMVLVEGLPGDMRVETLALPTVEDTRETTEASRLVSLGLAPAESGAWDRVDVLLRLRSTEDGASPAPRLQLGGQPLGAKPTLTRDDGGDRYLFASLPAEGQLLEVFVGEDSKPLGAMVLPDRQVLDVKLETGLPSELQAVLEADPGLRLVDQDADVIVGTRPGVQGSAQLWLNPKSDEALFRFTHALGQKGEAALRRRFGSLGLGSIDAQAAQQTGAAAAPGEPEAVRLEFVAGEQRGIEMPLQLLGDGYNFVQSRAFPLFFAEAMRWLASTEKVARRVAAGEILTGYRSAVEDSPVRRLDPVGASIYLPTAAVYRGESGPVLAASLQSPLDDSPALALPLLQPGSSAGTPLLFWITLLALLGLVAEWFLVRTGRMP